MKQVPDPKKRARFNMMRLLKPYSKPVLLLVFLALLSNGINLIIPKIIANGIDSYSSGHLDIGWIVGSFLLAAIFIFVFTYLQSIVETFTSERVARDLRSKVSQKIAGQSFAFVEEVSPGKLLTNLTSDADAVKTFISQAIVNIFSSVFIIIGASVFLISINWRLGLTILTIIPIIAFAFYYVFKRVKSLFKKAQGIIDLLNKVINESILGAALIRIVNAQIPEYEKFLKVNKSALDIGLKILRLFATLIPVVSFVGNLAMLTVLALGGHFVIGGTMTLGEFAAFNSYIALLIFPIIMIGFMSTVIARAGASYQRIQDVLAIENIQETGNIKSDLTGRIEMGMVNVSYKEKTVLKNISFDIKSKSRTAIIGPTAAGKTQLFYLLTGLIKPDSGNIKFDGIDFVQYDKDSFYSQVGLVFQDSIIFNISLRENIAFNTAVSEEALQKAIKTAELTDLIQQLPEKLNTIVSEHGSNLSGGQKQRIMLARALALNPKILLLDEFTARVDRQTEKKILKNIQQNYPDLTLLSITQTIRPIKDYDQIILLMDGELIAKGTHSELLAYSPEYNQIYQSQRNTDNYELQSV